MSTVIVILTSKTRDDVIALGGTAWWKIAAAKARSAKHVLLVHNAHDKRRPGDPSRHGQSFMIATIRDLKQDDDGRYLIQFDEFADTSDTFDWPGYRNPVTYMNADDVLGQIEIGTWETMPDVPFETAQEIRRGDEASSAPALEQEQRPGPGSQPSVTRTFGQILDKHRDLVAQELGIESSQVRITIEMG
ncbi:hypothetical protein AB0T83_15400 [Fluviibacterium sp. DFM31]|uniref:Uncharacterized protein n=1 Tax=Meridianimarinicoccus marinus TaxID=3231483 RepID=A0ABV3L9A7_9RHOB